MCKWFNNDHEKTSTAMSLYLSYVGYWLIEVRVSQVLSRRSRHPWTGGMKCIFGALLEEMMHVLEQLEVIQLLKYK
mgnify:CR=1 FL=1